MLDGCRGFKFKGMHFLCLTRSFQRFVLSILNSFNSVLYNSWDENTVSSTLAQMPEAQQQNLWESVVKISSQASAPWGAGTRWHTLAFLLVFYGGSKVIAPRVWIKFIPSHEARAGTAHQGRLILTWEITKVFSISKKKRSETQERREGCTLNNL